MTFQAGSLDAASFLTDRSVSDPKRAMLESFQSYSFGLTSPDFSSPILAAGEQRGLYCWVTMSYLSNSKGILTILGKKSRCKDAF